MKVSLPAAPASVIDPPRRVSAVKIGYPGLVSAWRAERAALGKLGASVHPASPRRCGGELRRVLLECRSRLRNLSDAIGAQPNQRVKLTAPS